MAAHLAQLLAGEDLATTDPVAVAMRNYIYLVGDPASRQAILVDPAYAPAELLERVAAAGFELAGVALTHYHADHAGGSLGGQPIAGVAALLELVDVPIHIQRAELAWVVRSAGVDADCLVAHDGDDLVHLGELPVALVHTPGHTPGSQCLLVEGQLLTGDTLFLRGCGRTDLPGGDPEALYESLTLRLAALDGTTVVRCGHAYDTEASASLERVRATNPVLWASERERWLARFT